MLRWQLSRPGELDFERVVVLFSLAALPVFLLFPVWRPFVPPSYCVLKLLTGWPCALCGGTRCLDAQSRGHWLEALKWNPLVAIGITLIAIYAIYAISAVLFGFARRPRLDLTSTSKLRTFQIIVISAIALNWIYLVVVGR